MHVILKQEIVGVDLPYPCSILACHIEIQFLFGVATQSIGVSFAIGDIGIGMDLVSSYSVVDCLSRLELALL